MDKMFAQLLHVIWRVAQSPEDVDPVAWMSAGVCMVQYEVGLRTVKPSHNQICLTMLTQLCVDTCMSATSKLDKIKKP